jgi:transaldolase
MKFFVDTADTAEIKTLAVSGLLDGVTTIPSFVAKTGKKFTDIIHEICAVAAGESWASKSGQ